MGKNNKKKREKKKGEIYISTYFITDKKLGIVSSLEEKTIME